MMNREYSMPGSSTLELLTLAHTPSFISLRWELVWGCRDHYSSDLCRHRQLNVTAAEGLFYDVNPKTANIGAWRWKDINIIAVLKKDFADRKTKCTVKGTLPFMLPPAKGYGRHHGNCEKI
jgi:hypothetical protein